MRVVAGTARGRRLDAPVGDATRPTSDRVREAVFNALGSLDLVGGATVLDLFAGTGALGIEALSRGAASATFVERDRGALAVIRANLDRCGFADRSLVVAGDAVAHARSAPHVDLALVDPPYAFDGWHDLLAVLRASAVVVESDREVDLGSRWDVIRHRSYGGTVVQIAASAPATSTETQTVPQELQP